MRLIVGLLLVFMMAPTWCLGEETKDGVTYYGNDDLRVSKRSVPIYPDSDGIRPAHEIMMEILNTLCDPNEQRKDINILTFNQIDAYIQRLDQVRAEAERGLRRELQKYPSRYRDYRDLEGIVKSCKNIWVTNKRIKTDLAGSQKAAQTER